LESKNLIPFQEIQREISGTFFMLRVDIYIRRGRGRSVGEEGVESVHMDSLAA